MMFCDPECQNGCLTVSLILDWPSTVVQTTIRQTTILSSLFSAEMNVFEDQKVRILIPRGQKKGSGTNSAEHPSGHLAIGT
jgi:hypothetical protein